MSRADETGDAGEPAFERNLRALLSRCYRPALPEAAFRARARAACLGAATTPVAHDSASRRHAVARAQPDTREAHVARAPFDTRAAHVARRPHEASRGALRPLGAWPRALAAAALLVLGITAMLWFGSEDRGDARRDAILARGEVAARRGPDASWESFGPDADDPDAPDVAHARLVVGSLDVFTPAGLGLDLALPPPDGAAGAFIEPGSSARLDVTAGVQVVLERGGLSLTAGTPDAAWSLQTPHGTLQLAQGALSAHLLAASGADGVWLLLDGAATLLGADSANASDSTDSAVPLPSGRALRLRHGRVLPADDATGSGTETGFDGAPLARQREPLAPSAPSASLDAPDAAQGVAAAGIGAAPAPRLVQGRVRRAGGAVTAFRLVLVPQDVPPRAETEGRDVSSEQGSFAWADVPPGEYALFVLAPGEPAWRHNQLAIDDTTPLAPFDIELPEHGATIAGFVTDLATGEPIAGATVLSETDAPARLLPVDASPMPDGVTVLAVTDASGAFRLDALGPGTQHLRATAPGHAPGWTAALSVAPGELLDGVRLALGREARIVGRVTDEAGRPWPGAMLIASPRPEELRPCVSYGFALTDAEGAFAFGNQPPGPGIVIMMGDDPARGARVPPRIQACVLAADTDTVVDFLFAPGHAGAADLAAPVPDATAAPVAGCRLHGLLLDADGTPLAQQMVSVVRDGLPEADAADQWRGALTRDDGSYEFTGLAPGAWQIFVGASDGASTSFVSVVQVPAAGELAHDVHLPGGVLGGHVVAAEGGEPVARAVAILMRRDASTGAWVFHARLLGEPSGAFRFAHLPAGRYEVTVHDIDGRLGQASSAELALATDAVRDDLSLALVPGGALVVRVRDARGAPMPRALVRIADASGAARKFAPSPYTGVDGVHRAGGMSPGLWFVSAAAPDAAHLASRELPVEVRAGGEQELVLVLPDAP